MAMPRDVPEVFVAVLEVDQRDGVDADLLRDQARRWFGTAAVRCLGVEVVPTPADARRPSYQVQARYVLEQETTGLARAGEWLGLVPRP